VQTGQLSFTGAKLYSIFVPNFVAMATGVSRGKILMIPSDSLAPKIGGVGANSTQLSFTGTELYHFEVRIGRNANFQKLG